MAQQKVNYPLLITAIAVLLIALYWPEDEEGSCPAGYKSKDGKLPLGHPPVAGKKSRKGGTIVMNATIWTGSSISPAYAEAMSIDADGRVFAVGSLEEVKELTPSAKEEIGLDGAFVVPGLIDSHVHLFLGGFSLTQVDFRGVSTRKEFVDKIKAGVGKAASGAWVQGSGWDENLWGGQLPSKHWLDEAGGREVPIVASRIDGHMLVASSAALEAAALGPDSADVAGGELVREEGGALSGVLKDAAMELIAGVVPEASVEERKAALQQACQHALSNGITAVHDMGDISAGLTGNSSQARVWGDLQILESVAEKGQLPIRVHAFVPLGSWRRMAERVKAKGRGSGMLTWGGVKAFMDGSLGSRTALFHDPYTDDSTTSGLRVEQYDYMMQNVVAADAAGLQVAVHAIGDRAVDDLIAIYSAARTANGLGRDRRFRIEHLQHVSTLAVARQVADLKAIVSPQPLHMAADKELAEQRLGPERACRSYPFRSLKKAGVRMAMGSDWTVAPLDALTGMRAANLRHHPSTPEKGPWVVEEAISLEDALRGYTTEAAYAAFRDRDIGVLEPGRYADFAVLSEDPLQEVWEGEAPPKVLRTYVNGNCAWGCYQPNPRKLKLSSDLKL